MKNLLASLIRREILTRYRGSLLGVVWSFLLPILMLGIYTFVFGIVFSARWTQSSDTSAEVGASTAEFAVVLFAGLILFQLLSEVIGSAPNLISGNRNYVKKIVFPIHLLPLVSAGAALFHCAISLFVLLFFSHFVFGRLSVEIIFIPVLILPFAVLLVGFAWFLSATGVFYRDVNQIVPPFLTATMFLSPIFFPRTALPNWLQPYLSLNPLTIPVEALRNVALFGQQPDWTALGYYSLVAIVVALLGERFFQLTRRGFADVL